MDIEHAYRRQKNAAKARGIAWCFTFDSWLQVWSKSGRIEERGRGRGKYVMARFGDVGPYSPENVSIILYEQNAKDCRTNHPVPTAEMRSRQIGSGRGWTFVKGAYQVCVGKKYIGRFKTVDAALAARQMAIDGISGIGRESSGGAGK